MIIPHSGNKIIYFIPGYYRVNYDKTNWNKIVDYLNSKDYSKIHVLNRLQIIEDTVYMFQNKKMEFSDFLKILTYLHREEDYIPWIAGLRIHNEFQNNQDNFFLAMAIQVEKFLFAGVIFRS